MENRRKTKLTEVDRKHVWHPFTQMRDYPAEDPVVVERAEGPYLFDIEGRRYLDGYASIWCNVHGHRVDEIDDAIRDQLDRVAHATLLGGSNIPAIELAAKLVHITPPGLDHVFYSDSGATAVEVALKMAFQYWQQCPDPRSEKRAFLHLTQSYHGDTIGAVSIGGIDLFHKVYGPLLFDHIPVAAPHPYRCSFCEAEPGCNRGCLSALEETLAQRADEIAAFFVEPLVQGAGGMLVHPEGYLRDAAELCRAHDVLFIVDEVATGFGRTGAMFACDREGVEPDMMCLGKGLTGGYLPLAATLATDRIYDAFLGDYSETKTFFHGHTYTGNPLACAAALGTLEVFEKRDVIRNLQPTIDHLSHGLERFRDRPHVGDVRQCGFIAAIELVANKKSRRPYPFKARIGHQVCRRVREKGILLRPLVNTIVLFPPLCLTTNQLDEILDAVYDAIVEVTESDG